MKHNSIYIPVKESLYSQELGRYFSFGIEVQEQGPQRLKVSDISTNESFVAELARRCTSGQLDPIHLYDVVEDSLEI